MVRFDFSSVTGIIWDGRLSGAFKNKAEFVESLFDSYIKWEEERLDKAKTLDPSQLNKWLNGKASVSPSICQFYRNSREHQDELRVTLTDVILPALFDEARVVQEIHDLLIAASNISPYKKEELCQDYSCADTESRVKFLAKTLVSAMDCPIPERVSGKVVLERLSPSVQDYFLGNLLPEPCLHFCGREQEIDSLHQALEQHGKVFVYGVPGIGKSELAKAYARAYHTDYTNILYLRFTGDIRIDIVKLTAVDDFSQDSEDTLFKKHDRFLQTLKEDSLLIIDNFSIVSGKNDLLHLLQRYRCRVLVTTRCFIFEQHNFLLEEFQDSEDLFRLAACFFSDALAYRGIVEEIIRAVHSHTFAVELATKLLESGILKPPMVLIRLQIAGVAYDYNDQLVMHKDGESQQEAYYGHIHNLFRLWELTHPQQDIMSCLSLIPETGVSQRVLADWLCLNDLNMLHAMIEQGYIRLMSGNRIALHPMMRDIVLVEITPSVTRCRIMLDGIRMYLHHQNFKECDALFETVLNTAELADKDDDEFLLPFLWDVFLSMEQHHYESGMDRLLPVLDDLVSDPSIEVPVGREKIREKLQEYSDNADHPILDSRMKLYMLPNMGNPET